MKGERDESVVARALAAMRNAAKDGYAIASVTHHARHGGSFDVDVMEAVALDESLFHAVSLRHAEHHPSWSKVGSPEHVEFWAAINEYAAACGGNTDASNGNSRRMDAVLRVEGAAKSWHGFVAALAAAERHQADERDVLRAILHGLRACVLQRPEDRAAAQWQENVLATIDTALSDTAERFQKGRNTPTGRRCSCCEKPTRTGPLGGPEGDTEYDCDDCGARYCWDCFVAKRHRCPFLAPTAQPQEVIGASSCKVSDCTWRQEQIQFLTAACIRLAEACDGEVVGTGPNGEKGVLDMIDNVVAHVRKLRLAAAERPPEQQCDEHGGPLRECLDKRHYRPIQEAWQYPRTGVIHGRTVAAERPQEKRDVPDGFVECDECGGTGDVERGDTTLTCAGCLGSGVVEEDEEEDEAAERPQESNDDHSVSDDLLRQDRLPGDVRRAGERGSGPHSEGRGEAGVDDAQRKGLLPGAQQAEVAERPQDAPRSAEPLPHGTVCDLLYNAVIATFACAESWSPLSHLCSDVVARWSNNVARALKGGGDFIHRDAPKPEPAAAYVTHTAPSGSTLTLPRTTEAAATLWRTETIIVSDDGPDAPRLWIGTDDQGDAYIGTIREGERCCMHATRLCTSQGGGGRQDVRAAVLHLADLQNRKAEPAAAVDIGRPATPGWYWAIHREGQKWAALEVVDYPGAGGLHVEYADMNEQGDYPLDEFTADGWTWGPGIYRPGESAADGDTLIELANALRELPYNNIRADIHRRIWAAIAKLRKAESAAGGPTEPGLVFCAPPEGWSIGEGGCVTDGEITLVLADSTTLSIDGYGTDETGNVSIPLAAIEAAACRKFSIGEPAAGERGEVQRLRSDNATYHSAIGMLQDQVGRMRAALDRIVHGYDDGVGPTSWSAQECIEISREALAARGDVAPRDAACVVCGTSERLSWTPSGYVCLKHQESQ